MVKKKIPSVLRARPGNLADDALQIPSARPKSASTQTISEAKPGIQEPCLIQKQADQLSSSTLALCIMPRNSRALPCVSMGLCE